MYPVIFWAEYWNSVLETIESVSGCTFAHTYTEAMKFIEDHYGEDLVSIKIKFLEKCPVIEFTDTKEADRLAED